MRNGVSMDGSLSRLADLYDPIRSDMREVTRVFDDELVSVFPFVNDLCERVRSYRGKMLRPALLLLSGRACGAITEAHRILAAVVEMVHLATLVHDDVLDDADERRGHASIHATDGNVAAVLLGDYLISHAYHLCSSLDDQRAARLIGATTNIVCEGELLQNRHCGNTTVDERLYFQIVGCKTGALTATSCELGAICSDVGEDVVGAFRSFGMSVGIAFQIVDDVLDIRGDQAQVGKSLGRDIAAGKLTLPTIHCLANAPERIAASVRAALCGNGDFDREHLCRSLEETDSLSYALSVASEYVSRARASLDILPPSDARTSLTAMAEFVIQRQL